MFSQLLLHGSYLKSNFSPCLLFTYMYLWVDRGNRRETGLFGSQIHFVPRLFVSEWWDHPHDILLHQYDFKYAGSSIICNWQIYQFVKMVIFWKSNVLYQWSVCVSIYMCVCVCLCVCVCVCVCVSTIISRRWCCHHATDTRHKHTTQSHYSDTGPTSPGSIL